MLSLLITPVLVSAPGLPMRDISFRSHGVNMAGRVFMPRDMKAGEKRPAVIVTGAWFTIQEQMPSTYARQFAEQGYVAMVFDFRNFGRSGGKARNFEDPASKAQDIKAAAQWLAGQEFVDRSRLTGMAMCASTGYMANAIVAGAPLRAFAASALWVQDAATVEAVYGGRDAVNNLLKTADEAAAAFKKTGEIRDVPAAGPQGSNAIMQQAPYYTDTKRGMIPQWDNKFNLKSWGTWLRFDSLAPASRLRVPTLVMHSDNAALPDMARRFHADLAGPKAIYWSTEGHMDFYDQPRAVSRSVALAIDHFDRHLGGMTEREKAEDAVIQLAASVDAKSWGTVRQLFADTLQVDYSSLGGRKGEVSADTITEEWKTFHAQFAAMRHTYKNFATTLNGDTAETKYSGIASLQRPIDGKTNTWTVAGDYTTTLRKVRGQWKITGTRFDVAWTQGQP